jgi:signal transduction histidine kinase
VGSALRELLERLRDDSHITFTLDNRLVVEPGGETQTAIYRIAQEALTNVRKHASAAHVVVVLREADSGCRVTIRDDGHGFDVAAADTRPGHLGLVSMRERAQVAGGWWTLACPPEGGTVVEYWMPMATLPGEPASGPTA